MRCIAAHCVSWKVLSSLPELEIYPTQHWNNSLPFYQVFGGVWKECCRKSDRGEVVASPSTSASTSSSFSLKAILSTCYQQLSATSSTSALQALLSTCHQQLSATSSIFSLKAILSTCDQQLSATAKPTSAASVY